MYFVVHKQDSTYLSLLDDSFKYEPFTNLVCLWVMQMLGLFDKNSMTL